VLVRPLIDGFNQTRIKKTTFALTAAFGVECLIAELCFLNSSMKELKSDMTELKRPQKGHGGAENRNEGDSRGFVSGFCLKVALLGMVLPRVIATAVQSCPSSRQNPRGPHLNLTCHSVLYIHLPVNTVYNININIMYALILCLII
jgi:hypothetical protein